MVCHVAHAIVISCPWYARPMLQQMVRAVRLDRRFYTELIFDDYATGNAVMVVALVYAILGVSLTVARNALDLVGLLGIVLGGIVGWLILGGVLWLVGVKLFDGNARPQTVMRMVGFTQTPLVLLAAGYLIPQPAAALLAVVGVGWSFAALVVATRILFDFDIRQATSAALLATAVWLVLGSIGLGSSTGLILRSFG
jgi:hypothetical protein